MSGGLLSIFLVIADFFANIFDGGGLVGCKGLDVFRPTIPLYDNWYLKGEWENTVVCKFFVPSLYSWSHFAPKDFF